MKFDTIDDILDFAIQKEQDAADFYNELSGKMDNKNVSDIFSMFAKEEMGHKTKLIGVKDGKRMVSSTKKVLDLKLGDNLVEIELDSSLSYQDALIVAMKAEKAAYRLYNNLATATDDAAMQDLFLGLAMEEAKHKLRFEIEYDDQILAEN
jgi:rubrerythrin